MVLLHSLKPNEKHLTKESKLAEKNQKEQRKAKCPLTTDEQKRVEADQLAASVRNNFPAGVGAPALRALAAAGYTHLEQLAEVHEEDLRKLHGIGPKAIEIIRAALKAKGMTFLS